MKIRPFRGLRPRKEFVEEVAVKPYDVVDEDEVRRTVSKKPRSFFRVTRPEVNFQEKVDTKSEEVLRSARKALEDLIESGVMFQDEEERFYLYRLQRGDHVQIGLVATFSVEDYKQDRIKKHELTRKEKEEERARHVYYVRAHTGPVYLMYRSDPDVDSSFEKLAEELQPEYDFEDEGVRHTFYVVKDKNQIDRIVKAFEKVEALYIADGHHRAAAAVRAAEWFEKEDIEGEEHRHFLAVVFPHTRLKVYEYNRVVKDLAGLSEEEFLEAVSEKFAIEEAPQAPYRPQKVHEFGMYMDGKWYVLKPKEGTFDEKHPVERLDVSILQNNLLSPILKIENPRTDPRIDFVPAVHGLGELIKKVDEGGWKVGFSLYPTPVEAIMEVSDAGLIMPPKSTWFDPKLYSGLVVHLIE